jgi:dihydropteroate synthase
MVSHNPKFISIDSLAAARKEIQNIGSDPKSFEIMAPKAVFRVIKLEQVVLQDTIIIKQDMLSLGGDVAIRDGDSDTTEGAHWEAEASLPSYPKNRC